MLLSRLELIDVFPRLMKLLTGTSWSTQATNYPKMLFCILASMKERDDVTAQTLLLR